MGLLEPLLVVEIAVLCGAPPVDEFIVLVRPLSDCGLEGAVLLGAAVLCGWLPVAIFTLLPVWSEVGGAVLAITGRAAMGGRRVAVPLRRASVVGRNEVGEEACRRFTEPCGMDADRPT